jgi:hypothetical protein
MDTGISITADETTSDENIAAYGFYSVHVSMPGEASTNGDEITGATHRCRYCQHPLREHYSPSEDGPEYESADDNTTECSARHEDEDEDEDGGPLYHVAEPIPGSFANSANIILDEEADEVTVTISVGDPRGAFAMTVRRNPDGKLYLSVPYAGMGWSHMPLTQVNDGYFRIGD